MINRTALLLIGAGLSLTPGSLPGRPQIQLPPPPVVPTDFPPYPIAPPKLPRYRPPAWLEFLKNHEHLAVHLLAAAVVLALAILALIPITVIVILIWIPVVVCRVILCLIHVIRWCRDRVRGAGPSGGRGPPD